MKTNTTITLVTLAVAMAMLAAPAVHAQEGYFNAEIGNGHYSAVEPPISPAYTEWTYFNPEIGNQPAPEARSQLAAAPEHTVKAGNLKLATATIFGDVVLQAGKYEVWKVNVGEEQVVEFSQIVENDYAPEGQSVYMRRVVARVSSTRETLDAIAALTQPRSILSRTAPRPDMGGGR